MTITQSSIRLHDMRFYAYHGVMEQERRVGGDYVVSLSVDVDLSVPVVSDSVEDTLNYAALYDVVARVPQVTSLSVEVRKVNPPMGADCQGASVELEINR